MDTHSHTHTLVVPAHAYLMDDVSFHSVTASRPPFAAFLFPLSSLSQTGIRLRGCHGAKPGPGNREMDVFSVGGMHKTGTSTRAQLDAFILVTRQACHFCRKARLCLLDDKVRGLRGCSDSNME